MSDFLVKKYCINEDTEELSSIVFENEQGVIIDFSLETLWRLFKFYDKAPKDVKTFFDIVNRNRHTKYSFVNDITSESTIFLDSLSKKDRGFDSYINIKGDSEFGKIVFRFPVNDEETKKRTIQLITSADIFIQENIVPAFNVKSIKINSIFLDGVVSFDIIFLPGEDCNTAIEFISDLVLLTHEKFQVEPISNGVRLTFVEVLSEKEEEVNFLRDEEYFLMEKANGMTYYINDYPIPKGFDIRDISDGDWGVFDLDYHHVEKLFYDEEQDCFHVLDGVYQCYGKDFYDELHVDEIKERYLKFQMLNELYNEQEIEFNIKQSFENYLICMKVPIELGYLEPYKTQVFDELFKELRNVETNYQELQVIYKALFFTQKWVYINLGLYPY